MTIDLIVILFPELPCSGACDEAGASAAIEEDDPRVGVLIVENLAVKRGDETLGARFPDRSLNVFSQFRNRLNAQLYVHPLPGMTIPGVPSCGVDRTLNLGSAPGHTAVPDLVLVKYAVVSSENSSES